MQIAKPWVMYKTIEEIGEAIQMRLGEAMKVPIAVAISGEDFLIVLQFASGNQAHMRFNLTDLKSEYKSVEGFVNFIMDCYHESMQDATSG